MKIRLGHMESKYIDVSSKNICYSVFKSVATSLEYIRIFFAEGESETSIRTLSGDVCISTFSVIL
jgi:hypothetical protein